MAFFGNREPGCSLALFGSKKALSRSLSPFSSAPQAPICGSCLGSEGGSGGHGGSICLRHVVAAQSSPADSGFGVIKSSSLGVLGSRFS